jgi:hypothetical protein
MLQAKPANKMDQICERTLRANFPLQLQNQFVVKGDIVQAQSREAFRDRKMPVRVLEIVIVRSRWETGQAALAHPVCAT